MAQLLNSGAQIRVAYTPETTFGVTPANAQLTELPMQSFTMSPSKELMTDPTITSDSLQSEDRHGNISTAGDLTVSLRHGLYDVLLSALFRNEWDDDVLYNGTTAASDVDSFTFETGDVVKNNYERYTGVRVNSLSMSLDPGQIITATFGLMGAGVSTATSPIDASVPAVQAPRSMSHVGGTIKIGNSPALITGGSFTITNNMEGAFAWGSSSAVDIVAADSEVSGDATLYRESDLTNFNIFLNEVTTSLTITVSDGENEYEIFFPVVKFNSAAREVGGKGLLFMPIGWKSYRYVDTVLNKTYSVRITRTPL